MYAHAHELGGIRTLDDLCALAAHAVTGAPSAIPCVTRTLRLPPNLPRNLFGRVQRIKEACVRGLCPSKNLRTCTLPHDSTTLQTISVSPK